MDDDTICSYAQRGDMSWYYSKKLLLLFLFSFSCLSHQQKCYCSHEVIWTQVLGVIGN